MLHTEQDRREALRYVHSNAPLQEAVGITNPEAIELDYLGAGEHNFNYILRDASTGNTCVLRVNVVPQVFHKDQIGYEHAALKAVEPSGRTPRVLYYDNSEQAPKDGALIIEFCEGDELDFDHLRAGDLRCAAQLMADIHAVEVAPGCALHRPKDPLRDLLEESVQRFNIYYRSGAEDPRITRWARLFTNAAVRAIEAAGPPSSEPHIVHTETLPSHFLIPEAAARDAAGNNAATGAFCNKPGYLIDWERPIIGEPAQDVAYFTGPTMTYWDSEFLFPKRDVEAFVADYWRAVDGRVHRGNFDERFFAYRTLTTLRSVAWCCKTLATYGSLDAVSGNDKIARKLPVYLSDDFN